ncbi:hypothetical protein I6F30_29775 [Bradyrhizobium sp. NBAIM20]|uniref:hypothetical protein n=1 Tax=unclassified Bradyrhizobium TaxID=2631580 RepID=UPI001CD3F734|nr:MULTISPECIES: hypothetical protein [unclassified Bradyrhizobium]MCA1415288.1 hypothetical protein [Bradyrhizobium sp. NBAIM20]MCA1461118.1 hypothetical protein [Bradyrhizobium sp. NBAIM18]
MMLHRPPSRPPSSRQKRQRRREQNRLAQARRRARERKHQKLYNVHADEVVLDAVIAHSIDAGLSVDAAERDARNRKKVSADLSEIIRQWARNYLRERKRQQ